MAFSFADVASGLSPAGDAGVQVHNGPELLEVQTDQLGFTGVNGEVKARVLPEPWPSDNLPIPSASLLSVASSQGLVAAAGPNSLVIATTEQVRKVLRETSQDAIRDIEHILTIPHSRIAHIAFSADESVLVVSREEGGLLVYQVEQLKNLQSQPALELATNGTGLRTVVANPAVQSAHLFACITLAGELLLADLSTGTLVQGSQGSVLLKNASSASWSNKGKQLVVGLSDGTAVQMKPDGTMVARIPKSTTIPDDVHISAISWLENDAFLVIYTPSTTDTDQGIPPSKYFIITRSDSHFTFQELPEILPPWGLERVPSFHFITRLRDWKPSIDDLLLLSSTAATEVGLISKASKALSSGEPVVNAFTYTTLDDDTRRAALPLSNGQDTSPIGMALDLSAKEGVVNPLPADPEIEETAGPVPNLMVLNNEGVLCSWWIIYNDSIREKTTYSGFANLDVMGEARAAASPRTAAVDTMQSITSVSAHPPMSETLTNSFGGQADTSTPSPFATPAGGRGGQSAFGSGSAFESSSKIGGEKNSWTSTGFSGTNTSSSGTGSVFGQVGFGQTAFGTPSSSTNAFNSRSALLSHSGNTSAPSFGQTGFGSKPLGTAFSSAATAASPFASATSSAGASRFASFAGSGGFAKADTGKIENKFGGFDQDTSSQSGFSKPAESNVFGQGSSPSPFAKTSPFAEVKSSPTSTGFGPSVPFKLESSFKGDGSAKDDLPKPTNISLSGLGSGFGDMLKENSHTLLSPTHNREEEMDDGDNDTHDENDGNNFAFANSNLSNNSANQSVPGAARTSSKTEITPPTTIVQTKTTPAQPISSLFGSGQQSSKAPHGAASGASWSFANMASTTPKETPAPASSIFTKTSQQGKSIFGNSPLATTSTDVPRSTPKSEPQANPITSRITTASSSDEDTVNINTAEPPLPPDPYSRPDFQAGDTSMSSINSSKPDDAPLPPDFLPANRSAISGSENTALPEEDEDEDGSFSSGFEDSGEDVTDHISQADEGDDEHADDDEEEDDDATEHVQTSPESSFKGENTIDSLNSPTGGLFTKVSSNHASKPARALFGEIGSSAPTFPPPKTQESPRSPSPVRKLLPHDSLRTDSRSVSAPVRARSAIDQRKTEYLESNNAAKAAQARQEEAARERARLASIAKAREQARAAEMRSLEDDEEQRLQHELSQPIQPTEDLDAFITYEPTLRVESTKADIPGQIERLYQDVNSMIYTLGINARSLESFMAYQKSQPQNESWPSVLSSETPIDALNDECLLQDIDRLGEGVSLLEHELAARSLTDVAQKLESCQTLLSTDLQELSNKLRALRRSIHARKDGRENEATLSAEQSAVQHDLRQAASLVQTSLIVVEDGLSLLRARISDLQPADLSTKRSSLIGGSPKKPTVEAVTNTIAKMTNMAEKRSADVDVLERQLKKLGMNETLADHKKPEPTEPVTPPRNTTASNRTPGSGASSIFYTPGSKTMGSAKSYRSINGSSTLPGLHTVSAEDKSKWLAKAERKKGIASALRAVLVQR